jgi:protein O-GlcNAc transferase
LISVRRAISQASRVGTSILHHAGLPELAATNRDSLLALAESLSSDAEKLAALRLGLRDRLNQSKLINCQLFTETLEDTYRGMWSTWCKT